MSHQLQQIEDQLKGYVRDGTYAYSGQGRVFAVLARLGNPHMTLRGFHVAGTNGKGSVCMLITGALVASRHRVGTFTGPDVVSPTERMQINARPVSEARYIQAMRRVMRVADQIEREGGEVPTRFELRFVAACWLFAHEKVEVCVIEAGMGGAKDATNIAQWQIGIITNVAADHLRWLGPTHRHVARNKAGIITSATRVAITAADSDSLRSIHRQAAKHSAKVVTIGTHHLAQYPVSDIHVSEKGTEAIIGNQLWHTNLIGLHQGLNMACAVAALDAARVHLKIRTSRESTLKGFGQVIHIGRFQIVRNAPLVIVEGGHNPAGLQSVFTTLQHMGIRKRKRTVIFAALSRKETQCMMRQCARNAKRVFLPKVWDSEFASPMHYRDLPENVLRKRSLRAAYQLALQATDTDGVVVICGSLKLAGIALREMSL